MSSLDFTQSRKKLSGNEDFNGLKQSVPTLPSSWYFDPQQYQHELDRIFHRNWIYLCHQSTFTAPRCYRSFNIGNQGILLVRDENNEIRGYHNTCRHRGSQLCTEPEGRFASRLIQCPYHQWAYSLDGRLMATSSHSQAPDFKREDYPLFPVLVKVWRGSVFVSLSDDPPDLFEGFSRESDRTENWPMDQLVVGHRWEKRMQCNWKVFWENFNECLHCPNIHPELCEIVPIFGRRISQPRDHPDWKANRDNPDPKYKGGLRAGAKTWSFTGAALDRTISGLTEEEVERGQSYFVCLPSVYIAAHVDYMRTVRILPLGPEQTELSVEWLFEAETLEQAKSDIKNITEFGKLVMMQDTEASELNQRGLRSNRFERGVLMPEEHYVKGFHDWVRNQRGIG